MVMVDHLAVPMMMMMRAIYSLTLRPAEKKRAAASANGRKVPRCQRRPSPELAATRNNELELVDEDDNDEFMIWATVAAGRLV